MSNIFSKMKNKKGMTYVELLVALSLLMIVIMAFTPMLLQSFDALYTAGERTENTYIAKSELEDSLALRRSTTITSFKENFEGFIENIEVKGRKVTSTVQDNFETMFHGAKASLDIISSSIVYDDTSSHTVTLQATNIAFTSAKVKVSKDKAADTSSINIWALFPNKTAGTESSTDEINVYDISKDAYKAALEIVSANSSTGRIVVKVSGCDFTKSPVKFIVNFKDEKGKDKTASCYLKIKAPTIMAVGATGTYDYYTSAGVVDAVSHDASGNVTTTSTFSVEGRSMPLSNSTLSGIASPKSKGITLQNVTFVDNDTDTGLDPYYVITGNNGSIYRMYLFNKASSPYYTVVSKGDKVFKLGTGSKVYPALWSGDYSHQFLYSTAYKKNSYGAKSDAERDDDNCWITEKEDNSGKGTENFAFQTKYTYYFNGFRTNFEYLIQNRRNVSYILTEWGYPLRFWGIKFRNVITSKESNDYLFEGFQTVWNKNKAFHGISKGSDIWSESDTSKVLYVDVSSSAVSAYSEYNIWSAMSTISLMGLNSGPLSEIMNTDTGSNDAGRRETSKYDNSDVNITGAVYIPKLGRMFYMGYVNANAVLTQANNGVFGTNAQEYKYNDSKRANATIYILQGNGTDTKVYKATGVSNGSDYISSVLKSDGSFLVSDSAARSWIYKVNTATSNTYHYYIWHNEQNTKNAGYWDWVNHWYNTVGTCWCQYLTDDIKDVSGNKIKMSHPDTSNHYHIVSLDVKEDVPGHNKYVEVDQATFDRIKSLTSNFSTYNNGDAYRQFVYSSYNYDVQGDLVQVASAISDNATYKNAAYLTTTAAATTSDTMDESNDFFVNTVTGSTNLENTAFTLGYSSNREFVYSTICYNGNTEKYMSYQEYYYLSHYGNANHTPNYTTNGSKTNLNSINNDYYNVWFPGECYNLLNTATKDGVTVAVGYAVSGSTYQWLDSIAEDYNQGGVFVAGSKATSTALGSIYNDGVLAVSADTSTLKNVLYFKDNATMDTDYLSDGTTNKNVNQWPANLTGVTQTISGQKYKFFFATLKPAAASSYKNVLGDSSSAYGTHARQSVRFTTVDILVESGSESSSTNKKEVKEYYAYYGDSTGRVFRSLVAKSTATGVDASQSEGASGTSSQPSGSSISPVDYVADLTFAGTRSANSGAMEEIKVTNASNQKESIRTYFSEIVSITAGDNLVVISGKPQSDKGGYVIVGYYPEVKQSNGDVVASTTMEYKAVQIIDNTDPSRIIQDGIIVGGYYYACGTRSGGGFIIAVDIEQLKIKAAKKENAISLTKGFDSLDALYSIAGRAT